MNPEEINLSKAAAGDIRAFQELFAPVQPNLKSYLYRLFANRNDAEDFLHDTFVRGFEKINSFRSESSFKTWIFQIATNLALDELRKRKRWAVNAQDKARAKAGSSEDIKTEFRFVHENSLQGNYEILEHIDFCFTCISKTLVLEQQVALMLKEVYDFSVKEIATLLDQSEGVIKHLLLDSRKNMNSIFENRCALINKKGACHQCKELNTFFNPSQNHELVVASIDLVKAADKYNSDQLFELRTAMIRQIDPLRSSGADLQEVIMKCVSETQNY
jgi:RNA polymerase sigma-70 factor (ECF subfamily)